MNELLDAVFATLGADFAVKILAANHVRGKLRPKRGDFAIGLFEQHFAVLALDRGAADFPVHGAEHIVDVARGEGRIDLQPTVKFLLTFRTARFGACISHA